MRREHLGSELRRSPVRDGAQAAEGFRMPATLQEQLRFEPGTETTNRKPLQQPALFEAQWELRFGPDNRFRAFYEIDHESRKVYILALAVKERNRLLIGGEEVKL
jgi:hypothetical protein